VIVDGTPVGATPLLLRGIRSGSHTVTIQKPGYVMVDEEVSVGTGETGVIAERLKATEFVAAFSAPTTIVNGQSYERTSSRFVLPTATYMLSADDTSLSIDPVYPLEGAFKTLLYVTPALAVISIGATLEDVWLRDKETGLPTPATFASWAATTAGGGMLIALALDRRRFFEETSIDEYTPALTGAESESLFDIGESALVAGNLPAALANYTQVVAHGADSEYVPGALYKTARIYQLSGDFDLALPAFTLLVERFPDPEYYDAALKATADLHVARGEYQDALDALDLMLFVDAELFPRSEIGDYAAEIRESMATGLPVESALEPAAEPAEEEQP
jgi:outer membrane protein assembly factor BamD (BamD/ComL family)